MTADRSQPIETYPTSMQLVLGCIRLDLTYERWLFSRINDHVSANAIERAVVDAEPLRFGKEVAIRRQLISFRDAMRWIGGMLSFS